MFELIAIIFINQKTARSENLSMVQSHFFDFFELSRTNFSCSFLLMS